MLDGWIRTQAHARAFVAYSQNPNTASIHVPHTTHLKRKCSNGVCVCVFVFKCTRAFQGEKPEFKQS